MTFHLSIIFNMTPSTSNVKERNYTPELLGGCRAGAECFQDVAASTTAFGKADGPGAGKPAGASKAAVGVLGAAGGVA